LIISSFHCQSNSCMTVFVGTLFPPSLTIVRVRQFVRQLWRIWHLSYVRPHELESWPNRSQNCIASQARCGQPRTEFKLCTIFTRYRAFVSALCSSRNDLARLLLSKNRNASPCRDLASPTPSITLPWQIKPDLHQCSEYKSIYWNF